ncbi:MAG: type II toxin-antitoxin system HicA family toxin [Candidatus Competibacter sp.]|nr:type II toxin-antitoxin system HicA family toxin [Candidatus Competibacter sp.]
MMASLYRELIEHLRAADCTFVRMGKGSHEIWYSPITGRTFTVPRSLASHPLANTILKQAGLPKAF